MVQQGLPGGILSRLILSTEPQGLDIGTVIVEDGYVDRDNNIAYAEVYSRAFRDHPRRTIRLHLFAGKVSRDELLDLGSIAVPYVGYIVLNPNRPMTIGRTVLTPPRGESWDFYPTQTSFPVNLAGNGLQAHGTGFAEQDGQVAACATAATWMSTVLSARRYRFDMPVRSMGEITHLATRHSLPPSGRGAAPGLNVQQILWALHEMGFEPLSHSARDANETRELVYQYVESGIPPILILDLPGKGTHAVTAVGHSYVREVSVSSSADTVSSSYWSPHFYIHDDQKGPYLRVSVANSSKGEIHPSLLLDDTYWLLGEYKSELLEWYAGATIRYVIAPLPPRHVLAPDEAALMGRELLNYVYNLYSADGTLGLRPPKPAVFRTYFTSSNDFRSRLVPEGKPEGLPGLTSELAKLYRGSSYPRYIWVTELCSVEHRQGKSPEELNILADVTIDPTASPLSSDFVTLHVPHMFFRMAPTAASVAEVLASPQHYIAADSGFRPLVRPDASQYLRL